MVWEVLVAIVAVFVGELYGNIVGGGSLVTQIALQNIIGLDIKQAMALDNTAVLGSNIGMFAVMVRKHKLEWWQSVFVGGQAVGAFLGAWILVQIDPNLLRVLFVIALVFVVVRNLIAKDGYEKKSQGFVASKRSLALLFVGAAFLGTYNSAFVIGDWIVSLVVLTSIFLFDYKQAVFLLVCSSLVAFWPAFYQYYNNDLLDAQFLVPMFFSTLMSGLVAGKLLDSFSSSGLTKFLKALSVILLIWLTVGVLS